MNKQQLKQTDRFLGTLVNIMLNEAQGKISVPREVQVLKTGNYFDARYGQFEITKVMLLSMKNNFDKKVMKIDPAFDYKHDADDIAAGWFESIDLRNDNNELWVVTQWTPTAEKMLSEKEFRYISADFTLNYIDNENLVEYGPTLRGAALTNRPVIKGMVPVTLTEGEGQMDEKDKLIAQLQQKVAELEKKAQEDSVADDSGTEGKESNDQMMALKKAADDAKAENEGLKKKLAEYGEKETKAAEEKKMAEKKVKFEKLLADGKAVKAQEEAFMKNDMEKFFELAEKTHEDPEGHHERTLNTEGDGKKDNHDQVIELAEKKLKETPALGMAKAISMVLVENPKLRNKR